VGVDVNFMHGRDFNNGNSGWPVEYNLLTKSSLAKAETLRNFLTMEYLRVLFYFVSFCSREQ
jgi:hypothetical protein